MTNIEFFLNVKEHGCFIFNISTSTVVYLIETNEGGLCFVLFTNGLPSAQLCLEVKTTLLT